MTAARSRPTYRRVHHNVVRLLGPASGHPCYAPGCSSAGQSWAYQGTAGADELTERRGTSLLRYTDRDVARHYRPACFLHHARGDVAARTGRCKRAEAEAFVLDLIDRHGQLLLSSRVYAAVDALGLDRFTLRAVRDRLGIETRMFLNVGGPGSIAVWLVPERVVPPPGRRNAGAA